MEVGVSPRKSSERAGDSSSYYLSNLKRETEVGQRVDPAPTPALHPKSAADHTGSRKHRFPFHAARLAERRGRWG